jgi:hydrogenase expression/formation protein HypC
MCLAIPGEVVELPTARDPAGPAGADQLALVDVLGVRRRINIGLLENEQLSCGDWVLIHVGFAMSKIDETEAAEALAMLELMGQAFTDELDAVAESRIE